MGRVKVDLKKLDKLIMDLTKNKFVRIGILGNNASQPHEKKKKKIKPIQKKIEKKIEKKKKKKKIITNSELAFIHEFGSITRNIPVRSFLRMPLELKNKDIIAFLQKETSKDFEEGDIDAILERVGIKGEAIIQEAFETKGFGQWPDNSALTIENKDSGSPLIDSSQLRRAVTSEVSNK